MRLLLFWKKLQYQKKNIALDCAKKYLAMMAEASVKGWKLLVLILSAQQHFPDAETIIDAALDETGKWQQGELLHLKEKLQISQGQSMHAIETSLAAFSNALAIEPNHVPRMISIASVLRQLGEKSLHAARSFLTDALQLEPTNHMAWFSLGMVHKMEGFVQKAADYFQAAYLLQESAPVEIFSSVSGHLQRTL